MSTPEIVAEGGRIRRRRHSAEFKAAVIEACRKPGVSIASVALNNGLNANLLRRWVVEAEDWRASERTTPRSESEGEAKLDLCGFVPVKIESPDPINRVIRIELRRGPMVVT